MNFVWPNVLWMLSLPLYWLLRPSRHERAQGPKPAHPNIARAEAAASIVRPPPAERIGREPKVWIAYAVGFVIIALARPQWGRQEQPGMRRSREILVALDLSRSMLTPDVAPSRLERAKLLTESLLDQLQGERVGLMVFSGAPFLQAPLSTDYAILREFLPAMDTDYLPDQGTDYGALLTAAPAAFAAGTPADRFLILLSDGGANDVDWENHLDDLKRAGIRVIALGIGTSAGGFIPNGRGGFLKDDQGAVVQSHLDSAVLRRLAQGTGGVYRDASNWVDVAGIVRATVASGRAGNFAAASSGEPIERYQWPLAAALICLVLSLCREFPPLPRARALRWAAGAAAALTLLGARAADSGAEPPQELLAQMVDRLASSPQKPSALDWADMAQQTVTWGRGFSEEGETVPVGPLRDALAAVGAGRKLDRNAADWPRIESDLKAMLIPPPPKPKPPPPQQNNPPRSTNQPPPAGEEPPPPPEPAEDLTLVGPLQQLEHVRQGDSPAQLFQLLARKRPPHPRTPPDPKPW
ncbi:MAG TPA: VWA domain-containing protein [Opitutaceae bacterium]|jgi:Ca-activated chloride channel family protein